MSGNDILQSLRTTLGSQGSDSIISFSQTLKDADVNGDGSLDRDELEQILGKFDGPSSPVSRLEAAVLWKAYAKTNGKIEYTKLISHIKNGSTNRRAAIVRKAFDKIRNGQEQIHKDSLFRQFRAQYHPMVVGEQKTEKEVRAEFELAFAKAGFKVSAQEFEDYFSNLSSTTSLDCDYFVFMIESVFGVKEDSLTLQTDTKYISNVMRVLKEKIRQKCKVEGKDKNTLRKHFQHFDSNENGTVSYKEFCTALNRLGLVLPEVDLSYIFQRYDVDQSGGLDYQEFVQMLYRSNPCYY